jgi:hypothetical protein
MDVVPASMPMKYVFITDLLLFYFCALQLYATPL